ncbi:DUF6090 family protein [uncultured Psychroserpens sp.]|uniref:DUF6090 family protein n=1 Tax=uncultured Psychroserpens sp. TaxID=255436 RepID=UPI002619A384|nr:DUF6090 family protein [uncultured Psychroserpens sp.]
MKLFNKQRFKLQKGSRLTKYITYALGEILLVVIGILIALWINNKQATNADQRELDRIIAVVKSDLDKDLIEANLMLKESEKPYQLITKILYNSKFQDSIRDCLECRYLLTQTRLPNFNSKGYELLSKFNKDVKTSNKLSDSILNFYSTYNKAFFDIQNKIILDEVVENMKFLRNNFSWFSEFYIGTNCNSDCLDYFESSDYINRLTYYEALFFDNFLFSIQEYRNDTQGLLEFLKTDNETI